MKKKFLPFFILLIMVSFANVSNAVTRREVEDIMQSLIHGKERNLPSVTTSSRKNRKQKTSKQQEKPTEIILEQEKLENDPYSYEIPEDILPLQQNKNKIPFPQNGSSRNKGVPKSIQQSGPGQLSDEQYQLEQTDDETDKEQEKLANDTTFYETRRRLRKKTKPKINVIKIPQDRSNVERETLDTSDNSTNATNENKFSIKSSLPQTQQKTRFQESPTQNSQTQDNEAPLSQSSKDQSLTREEVFLACLTKMGWANTLTLLKQLIVFNEYPYFSPVDFIRTHIDPAPPEGLFTPSDDIFPEADLAKLKEWVRECVRHVKLETKFTANGNSLYLIKKGVPTQSGYVQDMKAKNVPLFIVYYVQDPHRNTAEITPAKLFKHDKLPLSIIARQREGVELAINGGYFGAAPGLIIGVLRFKGRVMRKYFWPYRSGIAWNNQGEHRFFDGRFTKAIVGNEVFDKYTEVFQAGPMLIFNGETTKNTENLDPYLLNRRHPRSFVAEQPDGKLVWGLVDGRNAAHSVGMTMNELRHFCEERRFVNALNLDGGGSSSIWWNGIRFSRPSNQYGAERKIPYAILIYSGQGNSEIENIENIEPLQQASPLDTAPRIKQKLTPQDTTPRISPKLSPQNTIPQFAPKIIPENTENKTPQFTPKTIPIPKDTEDTAPRIKQKLTPQDSTPQITPKLSPQDIPPQFTPKKIPEDAPKETPHYKQNKNNKRKRDTRKQNSERDIEEINTLEKEKPDQNFQRQNLLDQKMRERNLQRQNLLEQRIREQNMREQNLQKQNLLEQRIREQNLREEKLLEQDFRRQNLPERNDNRQDIQEQEQEQELRIRKQNKYPQNQSEPHIKTKIR